MKTKSFGIVRQTSLQDPLDKHLEELSISGYSIMRDVLSKEELVTAREKLDAVYKMQVNELSEAELSSIHELNLARMLFAYDEFFIKLLSQTKLCELIKRILGDYFILHLQNGIINIPQQGHHQNSWHRDIPYHDFVISRPLAISALFCLDDFNASTGGTVVLPGTHKIDQMPSQEYINDHSQQITTAAGSIILFDSMLFHKAGYNSSDQIRRGVNHIYTSPILKQQINIPEMLNGKYREDTFLNRLFGYEIIPPKNVKEWRMNKIKKLNQ